MAMTLQEVVKAAENIHMEHAELAALAALDEGYEFVAARHDEEVRKKVTKLAEMNGFTYWQIEYALAEQWYQQVIKAEREQGEQS